MLPTFIIGLREGLEAALVVGIIATSLRQAESLHQDGARGALRAMWLGVAAAVALSVAAAVGLQLLDRQLPQRDQERLETVVAAAAVVMVTLMILWMRRNARGLASSLQASTATALRRGSAAALVAMAFLAVIREGIETAVFMLAAFQASGDAVSAGLGATLGVLVAAALGYGIYRGGVRLDLSRFFRLTGIVLVLVAAGLVMSALHTAHEAAWLNGLQAKAVDLSWLVRPGTIESSLLTGVLGLQPEPTVGEAAGWLLYAVPMLLVVLWKRSSSRRRVAPVEQGLASCLLVVAVLALAGCGGSSGSGRPAIQTLTFTLTDAGCSPREASAKTGPVTIEVVNGGTTKVTELELKTKSGIILGEKENVVGGISGTFTLNLQPGRYTLYCPNADDENGVLSVTGKAVPGRAADQARLATATAAYRAYVSSQADRLLTATRTFAAAIRAGNLERAKALFGPTRYHYEAIEPVAESFGELDPDIDARAGDVPAARWTGFHRLEKILWEQNTTAGTAGLASKLVADVTTLDRRVKTLSFQAPQLANGAVELLNEVASSKITGEEDRYSHTDLSDFAGNVEGARKAFELLRPSLVALGEKELVATIAQRFDAVSNGLDRYRRATPLGYALYSALTPADRRTFAAQIDALAEPLSTVAGKVSV